MSGSPSYSDGMDTLGPEERAALVALLQERPRGLRRGEITVGPLEAAAREIASWTDQGHTMLTILDRQYPERLREVHQAPPVLFARGSLVPGDTAVSVVGSRAASARGLEIAARIVEGLVRRNVTVVAGLAAGIDTAAHRAALDDFDPSICPWTGGACPSSA